MANRRFEMYEYRQVLARMRQGATDREIGRSGLMGRKKAGEVRATAWTMGWLERGSPLPDDGVLAEMFSRRPAPTSVSPLAAYREVIEGWVGEGFQATTILGLLRRKRDYRGSYSSVRRFLAKLRNNQDRPGEAEG